MRDPDDEVEDDVTDVRPLPDGLAAAERPGGSAYLVVQAGRSAGAMVRVGPLAVVIGRAPSVALRLLDDGVSREHARVEQVGGRVWLRDLGSTNGTWLEGERVGSTPLPLHDGDRIRLGPDAGLKYTMQDGEDHRFLADLYQSATCDPLTKVANRKHYSSQLEGELSWHRRHDEALSLLMLDIDHFKDVNTRWGHPAGDVVLRDVASTLLAGVRAEDLVARVGGEEFAVLLRKTTEADALVLAERLRQLVEEMVVVWNGERISVRISVGCATGIGKGLTEGFDLVVEADRYLLLAKGTGRNRVCGASTTP